jgi:membrane protease YdiL (CAAX protease family)
MSEDRVRKVALVAAPWALLLTTYLTYQQAVSAFGPRLGYLSGFLFYWIVWCGGFPLWVLGGDGVLALFRDLKPRFTSRKWLGILLLVAPLLLAYGYEFPRAVPEATLPIVLVSVVISVVNGIAEELLWRGTYARVFSDSVWWGYLYPTLGFAVWHFAPQSVFPNPRPGATVSLVVAAGIVGLMWGWVTYKTKSVRWTSLSHILFDFSGLGGRVYF